MKALRKTESKVWYGEPWDERFTTHHSQPGRNVRDAIYAHAQKHVETRSVRKLHAPVFFRWGAYVAAAAALLIICSRLSVQNMQNQNTSQVISHAAVTKAAIDAGEIWEETASVSMVAYDDSIEDDLTSVETTMAWLEQDMAYELSSL